jgi:hypothetical protein
MKKTLMLTFAICLFVSTTFEARAQAGPPPKVLSIFREEIKAGRTTAHAKLENGYVRALQKAKWPVYSLAMAATSGGTDAWFIAVYDSFAALEKDRQNTDKNVQLSAEFERLDGMDADFRTGQRAILCSLNEELTIGGNFDVSQMRYFAVNTVRVRPGHDQEYQEARKMLVEAVKKADPSAHSVFYAVRAGMPAGTYLIFTPRKSLAEMDPNPTVASAVQAALGDGGPQKRAKLIADSVISTETSIYAFSPTMSYVPKEWVKSGGEFWAPKPPAPKPVAKKPAEGEKPADKK